MKPIIVAHRINTVADLLHTPLKFGVEMDIHGYGDRLVVHHDPLVDGEDLEEWMDACGQRFVVFNIKEEGIESQVVDMARQRGIKNFALLDLSVPALIKMVNTGESRVAVRVSKYEPPSGALTLAGLANWVWLDVFDGLSLELPDYNKLVLAGFKICLVSPDLYSGRGKTEVREIQEKLKRSNMGVDAVCTTHPDLWQ